MTSVLQGYRVLDLTHVLAGPFAGYQLAVLGAEVIKIQREGKSFAVLSYRNNNLSIRFSGKTVPSDVAAKIKKLLEESDS